MKLYTLREYVNILTGKSDLETPINFDTLTDFRKKNRIYYDILNETVYIHIFDENEFKHIFVGPIFEL